MRTIGESLKKMLIVKRFTQAELAEKLDVNKQNVSNWINDKSRPDYETLLKISKIFNVSLETLITGEIYINDGDSQIVREEQEAYNVFPITKKVFSIDYDYPEILNPANIKSKISYTDYIEDTLLWEVDTSRYQPEINEGDEILIHVKMEAMNGDLVYCLLKTGRYLIGRYNRITEARGETVIITTVGELSYNQRIKPEEIQSIYRIMKVYPKPKTY